MLKSLNKYSIFYRMFFKERYNDTSTEEVKIITKSFPFLTKSQPEKFDFGLFYCAVCLGAAFVVIPIIFATDYVHDREVKISFCSIISIFSIFIIIFFLFFFSDQSQKSVKSEWIEIPTLLWNLFCSISFHDDAHFVFAFNIDTIFRLASIPSTSSFQHIDIFTSSLFSLFYFIFIFSVVFIQQS